MIGNILVRQRTIRINQKRANDDDFERKTQKS